MIREYVAKSQTRTRRACLRCQKAFSSEGPWNRCCVSCNKSNSSTRLPRIVVIGDGMGERVNRKRIGVA